MQRRDFVTLLGWSAFWWPLEVRAQQPARPVIGWLNATSPGGPYDQYVAEFLEGLRETGYVEGRNVAIDYRWAYDQSDRLPVLAAELVRKKVSVIFANTPAVPSAKASTTTTPIVFYSAIDPVQSGLVTSLNRPGGNITGVSSVNIEIGPKRLELLHHVLPAGSPMILLINPNNPGNAAFNLKGLPEAAKTLGRQIDVLNASTASEFETVFARAVNLRAGLVIGPDALFVSRSEQLGALSLRYGVPAIFQYREFTAAGGLMSYGSYISEGYRLAGIYVGRVLNGEKPAELPVQQSTRVELIINLKTAKALGLTLPNEILARADEVVE
jgi:putative tryptophan/tyrosine transport system substrate-binding protein